MELCSVGRWDWLRCRNATQRSYVVRREKMLASLVAGSFGGGYAMSIVAEPLIFEENLHD